VDLGDIVFDDSSPEFTERFLRKLAKHGVERELTANYANWANGSVSQRIEDSDGEEFEPQMNADERRWDSSEQDFEQKVTKTDEPRTVMTYPVLIRLNRRHDFIVEAGDGTRLMKIRRKRPYSRFWFTKEYFEKYPPSDGGKVTRREFINHYRIHNPRRIVGYAVLITVEAAEAIRSATVSVASRSASVPLASPQPMALILSRRTLLIQKVSLPVIERIKPATVTETVCWMDV
jgi:hypothetical protein